MPYGKTAARQRGDPLLPPVRCVHTSSLLRRRLSNRLKLQRAWRSPTGLFNPGFVWRRGATRILNSLGPTGLCRLPRWHRGTSPPHGQLPWGARRFFKNTFWYP